MPPSKKQSLSQKVVSVGTFGMPSPVRKILSGRIIASLIVLIIPILFATGLVSVTWKNGIPKLSINRQKADAVKENVSQKIQELRDKNSPNQAGGTGPLRSFASQAGSQLGSVTDGKPVERLGQKSADLIQDLSKRLD